MVKDIILGNDWHVVARSQDLPSGKILITRLLGENIVLWRSGEKVLAGQDRCPHRGASFSQGWVKEDNLICPYHGFAFNTEGKCVHVPAQPDKPPSQLSKACFSTYHVQERYELIWVCMGTPRKDVPALPEWQDSSFRRFGCFGPACYKASALRAMENFMDFNHTPFVHEKTLSSPKYASMSDNYQIEVSDDQIHINVNFWQINLDIDQEVRVNADYTLFDPLTICLRTKDSNNQRVVSFFSVTPIEEDECASWTWMFLDHAEQVPESAFNHRAQQIIDEDLDIVDTQIPRRLPLNLETEFHVESDRTSISYRKWLKKLGVTFGAVP